MRAEPEERAVWERLASSPDKQTNSDRKESETDDPTKEVGRRDTVPGARPSGSFTK